jgi:hypothetical protein
VQQRAAPDARARAPAGSGSLAGRLGRFPPFLVGWVSLVAFLGGLATCSLQAMQQVISMSMSAWRRAPRAARGTLTRRVFSCAVYNYGFPTPSGGSPAATQTGARLRSCTA